MTQVDVKSTVGVPPARRRGRSESPWRVKQWDLTRLVAEGTLARIYRARAAGGPPNRSDPYAVKVLRKEWEDDARAVELFRREAVLGRAVSHPHVVSVLASGLREPPYFVVMPWLAGRTLRSELDAQEPIDLPVVVWIARQVAEALGALAVVGWMHGDIKPSNIFISPEGHVTLLDLGFARQKDDEPGSVASRCMLGTCNYVAPEMITSSLGADIRSDIYALGVVLYEMLSGRLPFEGRTLAEITAEHKQTRPAELRRLVPHIPAGVVLLVRQMLSKEPLRRPQTPQELIDRLAKLEIQWFAERRHVVM